MSTSVATKPTTREGIFKKTRMEAFSDAVFAVALTLLIIDISTIGLPKLDAVGLADWQQHWWPDFWPKALAFVYSFAVVAVYW